MACWLQECPPELFPLIECSFIYHKPSPKAFQRIWEYFQLADVNVVDQVAHGGSGVMVWAGVCYGQRTQVHFIDGILNA